MMTKDVHNTTNVYMKLLIPTCNGRVVCTIQLFPNLKSEIEPFCLNFKAITHFRAQTSSTIINKACMTQMPIVLTF